MQQSLFCSSHFNICISPPQPVFSTSSFYQAAFFILLISRMFCLCRYCCWCCHCHCRCHCHALPNLPFPFPAKFIHTSVVYLLYTLIPSIPSCFHTIFLATPFHSFCWEIIFLSYTCSYRTHTTSFCSCSYLSLFQSVFVFFYVHFSDASSLHLYKWPVLHSELFCTCVFYTDCKTNCCPYFCMFSVLFVQIL